MLWWQRTREASSHELTWGTPTPQDLHFQLCISDEIIKRNHPLFSSGDEAGALTEPTCSVTLEQHQVPWVPCHCCLGGDPQGWDTAGSDPGQLQLLSDKYWNPHTFQPHKIQQWLILSAASSLGDFEVDELVIHVIPMHKTLLNFNTSCFQLQQLQLPLSSEQGQESEWDREKRKIPFPLQRTFCSTGWMEHLLQTSV